MFKKTIFLILYTLLLSGTLYACTPYSKIEEQEKDKDIYKFQFVETYEFKYEDKYHTYAIYVNHDLSQFLELRLTGYEATYLPKYLNEIEVKMETATSLISGNPYNVYHYKDDKNERRLSVYDSKVTLTESELNEKEVGDDKEEQPSKPKE